VFRWTAEEAVAPHWVAGASSAANSQSAAGVEPGGESRTSSLPCSLSSHALSTARCLYHSCVLNDQRSTLHPTPHLLYPAPYTLNPTSNTLHPAPPIPRCTLLMTPSTPQAPHPISHTKHPAPHITHSSLHISHPTSNTPHHTTRTPHPAP
jgi:hypothetical protein